MTKHAWAQGRRLYADGRIERADAPTQDELWELDLELGRWRRHTPPSMPVQLRLEIELLIGWQLRQCPWSREQKRMARWWQVDKACNAGCC